MTCRFLTKLTVLLGVTISLFSFQAAAWGPTAQESIVATALQVLSQLYENPFRGTDVSYEKDVIRGAHVDRAEVLSKLSLKDRQSVINAIGTEIQLLREMRKYGVGSYFSYRMGVLACLVSDVSLPFAFESNPESRRLLALVEEDIDAHLKTFEMTSRPEHLEYVRNPVNYFKERSATHRDAKILIAADYAKGDAYNGYLKKGGQNFFETAVVSVADAWYTVFRTEGDSTDIAPSSQARTWYLVNEIQFLLTQKKNFLEAENVYRQLTAITANDQDVYERVGDAFYAFDSKEGRERGVQEWDAALSMSGKSRQRIQGKLAKHYLDLGEEYFNLTINNPDAPTDSLQQALDSFTKSLEYDRSSDDAVKRINETQVAISERNERLQLAVQMVANGESVLKEAEGSALADQNEEALAKYEKAILVLNQVSSEFKEQASAAKDGVENANRAISKIIRKVLDQAQEQIDQGDQLVEDKSFEEAKNRYSSVETILKVVPEREGPDAEQKHKLLEESKTKIGDAERAKVQYEELQKSQAAQPAGGTAAAPRR
ncbi:MAG: hypothetical protein IT365_26490 [Candidatus Hydrogenedentes bacterium]|nr:hypothetical protein [Candidatus Hydrogenedentota bacterium]